MKVTLLQIENAYRLAVAVFDDKISEKAASTELQTNYALNISSAEIFIKQYRHMRRGEVFQRTMSVSALKFFLEHIQKDLGQASAQLAIMAVRKHLEYHGRLGKGKQKAIRSIVERFEASLSPLREESHLQKAFELNVQKSLNDSPSAREQRLREADTFPKIVITLRKSYLRNPDVVAVVLSRASGTCERCKMPAPFLRKMDGTPYLEVHHNLPLARNGQDTVENAIALCPNCHREMHHGTAIYEM